MSPQFGVEGCLVWRSVSVVKACLHSLVWRCVFCSPGVSPESGVATCFIGPGVSQQFSVEGCLRWRSVSVVQAF